MVDQTSVAKKRFELENNIQDEELYSATEESLAKLSHFHVTKANDRPWRKDQRHFQHVKISAVALIKMAMHAKSGGEDEVMGML